MLHVLRAGGFNMWVLVALALSMLWTAIRFARNADLHRLSIPRPPLLTGFTEGRAPT